MLATSRSLYSFLLTVLTWERWARAFATAAAAAAAAGRFCVGMLAARLLELSRRLKRLKLEHSNVAGGGGGVKVSYSVLALAPWLWSPLWPRRVELTLKSLDEGSNQPLNHSEKSYLVGGKNADFSACSMIQNPWSDLKAESQSDWVLSDSFSHW